MDAKALVEAGRAMQARGWVPATSGNLSIRDRDGALITPSGRDKGGLSPKDLVAVDVDGRSRSGRPSAETRLHLMIYRRFPEANAILHAHCTSAVVLSRRLKADVPLSGFELIKALDGVHSHDADVRIPVIDNDQDMDRLVPAVEAGLDRTGSRWAFVLTGHGIYAWGGTVREAYRHLDAIDTLFGCLLLETR